MGVGVGIDIDLVVDSKKTLDFLDRMVVRMRDLRPAWQAMHAHIKNIVYLNIVKGGRPPWPPKRVGGKKFHGAFGDYKTPIFKAATNPALLMWLDRAAWVANVGKAGIAQHYGTNKTVTVPSHNRRITSAFGKPIAPVTFRVPSYSMRVNIPARPFFCIPLGYGEERRLSWVVRTYLFTASANYRGLPDLDYGNLYGD